MSLFDSPKPRKTGEKDSRDTTGTIRLSKSETVKPATESKSQSARKSLQKQTPGTARFAPKK